ncbi:MAG: hypothetical protein ABH873_05360 [Candidatus Firestonebacteria bacterium]
MYSWTTVLKIKRPYLIIGTRGEGIAIINLNNFYLKRIFSKEISDVEKIDIIDSEIKINDSIKIPFPNF